MAINVTDVVSQFGSHYIANPSNQANLRNTLYKAGSLGSFFQDRPTEDTIWRGTLASLSRIVQPFQKAFTPISTTTFKPNSFPLFKLKIDLQETPDDLEGTYLGFLASLPEVDRKAWPFVRWWMENHVMPKAKEDVAYNEYYTGVYGAPTAGTAGAAGTAMDGIRKVIRAYNTAGRTNNGSAAIVTGAPNSNNTTFVGQVEAFVDAIPDLFKSKIDVIFMSKTNQIKYLRGKRDKYGLTVNFLNGSQDTIEDYPSIRVVGIEEMNGSNLIFATTPENRVRPIKKAALANQMMIESVDRTVKLFTDWWEALNFEVPEFVFHNDQDLV
jgi:hypothetical protein